MIQYSTYSLIPIGGFLWYRNGLMPQCLAAYIADPGPVKDVVVMMEFEAGLSRVVPTDQTPRTEVERAPGRARGDGVADLTSGVEGHISVLF